MVHAALVFVDAQRHRTHGIERVLHVIVIVVIQWSDLQQFVQLQRILTDTFDRREKKTTIEVKLVPIGQQSARLNDTRINVKSANRRRFDVPRRS